MTLEAGPMIGRVSLPQKEDTLIESHRVSADTDSLIQPLVSPQDMPFLEAAKASLRCPIERVTLVEDASGFDVRNIESGVVIFLADWSAPACLALAEYSERLNSLNPSVPVWVVNVDTFEPDGAILSHGWGEAYFFRKGRLIDQLLRSKEDIAARFEEKFQAFFPAETRGARN